VLTLSRIVDECKPLIAGSVPGLVAGAKSVSGRRRALRAASGRWYAVSSDIAALLVEAIHDKAAGAKNIDDVLLFANLWGRTYGVAGGTYTATGACTAADAQIGILKDKIVANISEIDAGRAWQMFLAMSSKCKLNPQGGGIFNKRRYMIGVNR